MNHTTKTLAEPNFQGEAARHVPRWVQVATGAGLGAIALAALKVDVFNNYAYGMAEGGPELATVMVLAAISVVALPVAAAIYGWSTLLRIMTALCVLMTCWAAVNAYATKMGASILSKTSQASVYAGAEQDQAAARATLARIKETADTATLEALVAAAKGRTETAEKSDTSKMGSPSCFKSCKAAQADHITLLGRVSEAKARDAARLALAAAKTEAKAGPAEASMAATWIAARTGSDAVDIARSIALAMTLLGIVVTQGAALLAHSAVTLISSGLRGNRREVPGYVSDACPSIQFAPAAPRPLSNTVGSDAEAHRWLVDRILAAPGRKLTTTGRELALLSGVPASTFAKRLNEWRAEGKIVTARFGNRTVFSLPHLRQVA